MILAEPLRHAETWVGAERDPIGVVAPPQEWPNIRAGSR
jgi:hypothetical protein